MKVIMSTLKHNFELSKFSVVIWCPHTFDKHIKKHKN